MIVGAVCVIFCENLVFIFLNDLWIVLISTNERTFVDGKVYLGSVINGTKQVRSTL